MELAGVFLARTPRNRKWIGGNCRATGAHPKVRCQEELAAGKLSLLSDLAPANKE